MQSLSQAVANKGWRLRPISISDVARGLSLSRPILLTILIRKCYELPKLQLTLSRITGDPVATHAGALNASGIIKNVKNLEQFGWWLAHTDNKNPPTWVDGRLNPGEVTPGRWAGMGVGGGYKGNYGGADPIPYSLRAEIELQT